MYFPEQNKILPSISISGHSFLPVALAAHQLQISKQTMYRWIKGEARSKRCIRAIQTLEDGLAYVSEEDVEKLKQRFVCADTGKALENVALLRYWKTENKENLFLTVSEASHLVRASSGLMRNWSRRLQTSQGVKLEVAIDTVTEERFLSKASLIRASERFR